MSKFINGLVKEVREKDEYNEKQEKLKKIYKLETDKEIVEKSNTIKFLIKTCISVIKTLSLIILVILAGIGISVFLLPNLRSAFIDYITQFINYFNIS